MPRSIASLAVFCGSNFGNSDAYADGARQLGRALADANITLVYGGTMKGLMGVVADALIEAGGTAHGVITEQLQKRGHTHPKLHRSEIVATLRTRKERMAELADAFIAMPGGIGTMEKTRSALIGRNLHFTIGVGEQPNLGWWRIAPSLPDPEC
jgi:uncharacterized protein (TIGR00730 family)